MLSVAMRKRLAEGPQVLRQAYMRRLLEAVTIDHHSVGLEGSPAVLETLARYGTSKSCAEVLSSAQGWRPREEEAANSRNVDKLDFFRLLRGIYCITSL